MNIGTLVPSLLSYQTWVEMKFSGRRPLTWVDLSDLHFSPSFRVSSNRYWQRSEGLVKLVRVAKNQGCSLFPQMAASPTKSGASRVMGLPSLRLWM